MRIPPSATAVRVGMVISNSNRERTRQFFSARLDAGLAWWGTSGCPAPLPSACPSGLPRPPGASTPSRPNAEPFPAWSPTATGAAGGMFLLRDRTRHDLFTGCHGEPADSRANGRTDIADPFRGDVIRRAQLNRATRG